MQARGVLDPMSDTTVTYLYGRMLVLTIPLITLGGLILGYFIMVSRAARLLADLGNPWSKATPAERAEIAASLFAQVTVRDDEIVRARLAHPAYLALIASATARSLVSVARPEGDGRALTACRIPIEGRDEWVAAARERSA